MKTNQGGTLQQEKSSTIERFEQILLCLTALSKVQRNYGKTPNELKDQADAFDLILPQHFSAKDIKRGFLAYACIHPDVPAPSHVANILDHGYPEPYDGRYVAPTQRDIRDD
jgi:hypothetical protein